jgi:hypothetical protein
MLCVGVLGVLTLSVLSSGCSNASDPAVDTAGTGTVDLPLTAQADGVQYRLANAKFTITGTSLIFTRTITPAADLPIDQEVLAAGTYSILLADGWQLQAKGPTDTTFSDVDAVLAVENPLSFTVTRGKTVDAVFAFITHGIPIKLSKGRANVRISVSDCSGYDNYTATIAGLTVDCIGTIDQNSYLIDDSGFLVRNFAACTLPQLATSANAPTLLDPIDALLGLQYSDREALPDNLAAILVDNPLTYAKDCIAGQWAQWRESFDASGTTDCPSWTKSGVINPPTVGLYQKLAGAEPQLPAQEDGTRAAVLSQFKINSLYTTAFADNQNSDQNCGSAGACAALCASGFPGFIVDQNEDSITTDPPPWNDPTVYSTPQDPYQPSYYHPMSFYGPVPGALFGVAPRADPTFTDSNGNTLQGEACSVYVNGTHSGGRLHRNCRVSSTGVPFACLSVCVPDASVMLQ